MIELFMTINGMEYSGKLYLIKKSNMNQTVISPSFIGRIQYDLLIFIFYLFVLFILICLSTFKNTDLDFLSLFSSLPDGELLVYSDRNWPALSLSWTALRTSWIWDLCCAGVPFVVRMPLDYSKWKGVKNLENALFLVTYYQIHQYNKRRLISLNFFCCWTFWRNLSRERVLMGLPYCRPLVESIQRCTIQIPSCDTLDKSREPIRYMD